MGNIEPVMWRDMTIVIIIVGGFIIRLLQFINSTKKTPAIETLLADMDRRLQNVENYEHPTLAETARLSERIKHVEGHISEIRLDGLESSRAVNKSIQDLSNKISNSAVNTHSRINQVLEKVSELKGKVG